LDLAIQGEITNIGRQQWIMCGGQLLAAYILGSAYVPGVNLTSPQLTYNLDSNIRGNDISGDAQVLLKATIDKGSVSFQVKGNLAINNMNGALCFPLPPNPKTDCDIPDYLQPSYLNNASSSGYTSAIPFFFEGPSSFTITGLGAPISTTSGFAIEAPGDNLFGGPIILASADHLVVIVASYTEASAQLDNLKIVGKEAGNLVSSTGQKMQVSGLFKEISDITENFLTGVQYEHGTMTFIEMTPNYLDVNGQDSAITKSMANSQCDQISSLKGGCDCSWATGIPGTCYLALLNSAGSFKLHSFLAGALLESTSPQIKIFGTFTRTWSVPAAGFFGKLKANVRSLSNQ
jgi:hypothetical protein